MIELLTKPLEQIDKSDIETLISVKVPEGEQIEFKKTLSSSRKNRTDPWIGGEDQIGESAKNKILKEVVAFANAHGGALLLGIDESDNKPPVAVALNLIPRCTELAERFKLVFRDRIEPNLLRLEIRAIPIENEAGIVIFRVGRSPLSPHRIMKTLICPIRRSDRCEDMTMREIQDMTLNLAKGHEKIESKFAERSKCFRRDFQRLQSPNDAFGIRLSAMPVSDEIRLERVFYANEIVGKFSKPNVKVFRQHNTHQEVLTGVSGYHNMFPTDWRPMLRGTRAEVDQSPFGDIVQIYYWEIHCDGLVELGFYSLREFTHPTTDEYYQLNLRVDLPVVEFANLIFWADKMRNQASAPTTEYAIDVEITIFGDNVSVTRSGNNTLRYFSDIGELQPEAKKFPRYALGDLDNFPQLVALFERDFWHSFGKDIGIGQGMFKIQSN